jgi:hypothetical protein
LLGDGSSTMYGMLVSTVPLDCKEVEDVFDIIIRRETVYAVLWWR